MPYIASLVGDGNGSPSGIANCKAHSSARLVIRGPEQQSARVDPRTPRHRLNTTDARPVASMRPQLRETSHGTTFVPRSARLPDSHPVHDAPLAPPSSRFDSFLAYPAPQQPHPCILIRETTYRHKFPDRRFPHCLFSPPSLPVLCLY